ncbi:hypothetical protein D3C78_568030 [compost metagenome]
MVLDKNLDKAKQAIYVLLMAGLQTELGMIKIRKRMTLLNQQLHPIYSQLV